MLSHMGICFSFWRSLLGDADVVLVVVVVAVVLVVVVWVRERLGLSF